MIDFSFYKGKRVFVTGDSGFKGAWLCRILKNLGAELYGYSLLPNTKPALSELIRSTTGMKAITGDVRDFETLKRAFDDARPEIVFHLAAQPIVLEGYERPRYTYEVNVMGTVNLLECVRLSDCVRSVVNVTTDKVYENNERREAFIEDDKLDGYDPYSNSKSCSELVSHSYAQSLFADCGVALSTARAGNVIGGGDFASHRILPDCARAAIANEPIVLRNPNSVRPYQHVLEPLIAYLLIAQRQYENSSVAGSYNVGPDLESCCTTGELATLFTRAWGGGTTQVECNRNAPHEAGFLSLNCNKLKETLGWRPVWSLNTAVERTVEWYKSYGEGGDLELLTDKQIANYLNEYPSAHAAK